MRRWATFVLAATAAATLAAGDKPSGTLDSAMAALAADRIEYSGSGKWYQVGQGCDPKESRTIPP